MSTLTSKYPQWLIILKNPQIRSPIGWTRRKIAAKRWKFDIPHGLIMSIVHHQGPLCLQTPSPYCVIVWATQQMLITNGYSDRKDRPRMPNQLILLSIRLLLLNLLRYLKITSDIRFNLTNTFLLLLWDLHLLLLLHDLQLLMQFNRFFDHLQIFLNLLFNHFVHS